ncbi:cation:dicarboxylate symporter family transporter [Rhabdochlamydiaceae symbiont of Dictyostelium giganteum]|uniref:cation:dicarboxylate symporter family transporter n=1 Tax=Rhabdochlamydiaceae symbiont of Dictyostelium giganteum TaxID=3342349 RepID=UPI00384D67C7
MMTFFRRPLYLQMLIATFCGAFLGIFLGDLCTIFAPWEEAYVMILKVTTIPYLICAVIHGVGRLSLDHAKNILQKGLLFITCFWIINILCIYLIVYLFPKSDGVHYASYTQIQPSSINFAELLIPSNIFAALANNLIPAVVVFGLLIGIALMHVREKQTFMGVLDTLVKALTTMTGWISRLAPLGTFLIMADRIGSMHLITFKQIGTYLILYILGMCLLALWIIPHIVGMLTNIPAGRWLKSLAPIMLVAFTTNLVIVTLPFLIEIIKREIEIYYHKESTLSDQVQGIVSVLFNLPLGSLFITVFIFFTATFYNISINSDSQIQLFLTTFLTSLGSIGMGSWINSLNFLLGTLGLPLNAIDTYMATLPFTAGFQSITSVVEISSLSLLVALSSHKFLKFEFGKIAKHLLLILFPVFLFIGAFKNWIKLPPITNPAPSIYHLSLPEPVKVHVYGPQDLLPPPRSKDPFDRILASRILRVGYNPESVPFCFYNEKGDVVGYDIALAYALAQDLKCQLELVPINLSSLAKDLNQGLYDIAMSCISINEERLEKAHFTQPYLKSRLAFTLRKKLRKAYASPEALLHHPHVKLVVKRGSTYEKIAYSLVPPAKIAFIDDYEDFITYYPNDVLLRGEFQSLSWSSNYPDFTVIIPESLKAKDTFGYMTAQGSHKLQTYLDAWLELKKSEGFTEEQFNIWVLGKTASYKTQTRRWSIIRDVLGWTEN